VPVTASLRDTFSYVELQYEAKHSGKTPTSETIENRLPSPERRSHSPQRQTLSPEVASRRIGLLDSALVFDNTSVVTNVTDSMTIPLPTDSVSERARPVPAPRSPKRKLPTSRKLPALPIEEPAPAGEEKSLVDSWDLLDVKLSGQASLQPAVAEVSQEDSELQRLENIILASMIDSKSNNRQLDDSKDSIPVMADLSASPLPDDPASPRKEVKVAPPKDDLVMGNGKLLTTGQQEAVESRPMMMARVCDGKERSVKEWPPLNAGGIMAVDTSDGQVRARAG